MILVPDPYFNEPGCERSMATAAGKAASRQYNEQGGVPEVVVDANKAEGGVPEVPAEGKEAEGGVPEANAKNAKAVATKLPGG
eukprot:gene21997-29055_t